MKIAPNPDDRARLTALLNTAWKDFYTDDGWRNSARPVLPGMVREAAQADGALPSPTALLVGLSLASGDDALVRKASSTLPMSRRLVHPEAFWYGGHAWLLIKQASGAAE